MTKKSKNPCLSCDCWDSDAEGCTMPHYDKWYACPIESEKPENQRMINEMAAESEYKKIMSEEDVEILGCVNIDDIPIECFEHLGKE